MLIFFARPFTFIIMPKSAYEKSRSLNNYIHRIGNLYKTVSILTCILFFLFIFPSLAFAQLSECSKGMTLSIVAHQDDDLLFLNPDILHTIQQGRCVRTVYITAGDAGLGASYWQGREQGEKAAYAQMAGVKNEWSQQDAGIRNHPIPIFTLKENAKLSLAFIRLPDGGGDGSGFGADANQSLKKLWNGDISTISAVDGSSSYTKQQLVDTILSLMTAAQPAQIATLNYLGTYASGDHSDHISTGYFAYEAHKRYTKAHAITAYVGYPMTYWDATIFGTDKTAKQQAFFSYGQYDPNVCKTEQACASTDYGRWFERQYVAGTEQTTISPTLSPTPTSKSTPTPWWSVPSAPSRNPTVTATPTPSPRVTITATPTTRPTVTATPTRTPTPSLVKPSITLTPTPTAIGSLSPTPTWFSIPTPKSPPAFPTR